MSDTFILKFGVIRDGKNYTMQADFGTVKDMAYLMRRCGRDLKHFDGDKLIGFIDEFRQAAEKLA